MYTASSTHSAVHYLFLRTNTRLTLARLLSCVLAYLARPLPNFLSLSPSPSLSRARSLVWLPGDGRETAFFFLIFFILCGDAQTTK